MRSRSARKSILVLVIALALAFVAAPALAAPRDSPARKLGRGVANFSLGVMAIPDVVIDTTKEHGPALGVTWGLVKGTGMMLATEVVGLFEIMTCPFATPPDYRPILSPEFPWQRFTGDPNPRPSRKGRSAREGGRRVPR